MRKIAVSKPADMSSANLPVTAARKLRWLILAFIPSSLMLGLTTHLTTDIASVPLLWVVPLALYLLSFVIAFARKQYIPQRWYIAILPILVLIQTIGLAKANVDLKLLILIPMPTFLVLAIACHKEIVMDRPAARHLTEFYLLMSVGGMLGGMFNALLAPQIFRSILEYPIMLVLACVMLLIPRPGASKEAREAALKVTYADTAWIAGVTVFLMACLLYANKHNYSYTSTFVALALGLSGI